MLKPLDEQTGFIGGIDQKTYKAMGEDRAPNYPTSRMPTERVAKVWRAILTGEPCEHWRAVSSAREVAPNLRLARPVSGPIATLFLIAVMS